MVGVVGQDPLAGFVTDTVEEELAYAMEQLAVPPAVMRKRVEETLDLLGIADLRDRPAPPAVGRPAAAGGDRLGADRPSAGAGARRADLGARPDGGRGGAGRHHPAGARPRRDRAAGRAPAGAGRPVRRHGRRGPGRRHGGSRVVRPTCSARRRWPRRWSNSAGLAGWDPLPLSVRDARRLAAPLRRRLDERPVPAPRPAVPPAGCPPSCRARKVVGPLRGPVGACGPSTSSSTPARSPP